MSAISVDVLIHRSRSDVWEELRQLERHVHWMSDARAITFHTSQRQGVGTTFDCRTQIGPFITTDVMLVTRWDEGERIGVTHQGIVTGRGEFVVRDEGDATRMTWHENLTFPWWMGGAWGALAATPLLRILWRRNLFALERLLREDH